MLRKQRRIAVFLWCGQVDAAAVVEAEVKDDGGGRARRSVGARKKMTRRGMRGKSERDPSALFIR